MGYPADRIEQANDVLVDKVIGPLYGAVLRSQINEEGSRNEWGSRCCGTSAAVGGNNSGATNNRAAMSNHQKAKDNGKIAEREALKSQKTAEILAKHAIAQIMPILSLIDAKRKDTHYYDVGKPIIDTIERHASALDKCLQESHAALSGKPKFSFDAVTLKETVADARKAVDSLEGYLAGVREFSQLHQPSKRARTGQSVG